MVDATLGERAMSPASDSAGALSRDVIHFPSLRISQWSRTGSATPFRVEAGCNAGLAGWGALLSFLGRSGDGNPRSTTVAGGPVPAHAVASTATAAMIILRVM